MKRRSFANLWGLLPDTIRKSETKSSGETKEIEMPSFDDSETFMEYLKRFVAENEGKELSLSDYYRSIDLNKDPVAQASAKKAYETFTVDLLQHQHFDVVTYADKPMALLMNDIEAWLTEHEITYEFLGYELNVGGYIAHLKFTNHDDVIQFKSRWWH